MWYRDLTTRLACLCILLTTLSAVAESPTDWGVFDGEINGVLKASEGNAQLTPLVKLHQGNTDKRIEAAALSIGKQVEEMKGHLEKDDLFKALTSAIRAKGMSIDPERFVNAKIFRTLVSKVEAAAKEAETKGDWIESLNLYSRLNLIFDHKDLYKKEIKRAGQRVGLLRMYAPEYLYEQLVAHAKERGEDKPEPWDFDESRWPHRLRDINFAMLRDSISLAALRHVESASYEQLITGGLEAMDVFLSTKGMENTFDGMKDEAKRTLMHNFIKTMREAISKRETTMSAREASATIRQIIEQNDKTIALPEKVLIHEFADGAMSTLDDYSSVIWPFQKERLERTTTGKFSGVGIQISMINRQLTVVTPLEDTPAHRAGIKAGDQIVSVDGKSTLGIDLNTAVEKITGEQGTEVILGIKSSKSKKKEVREVKLIRSEIPIRTIKGWERMAGGEWNYYLDEESKIGFIRMSQFGASTVEDLDKAVTSMKEGKGLNGLIIDLRFNPGGLLSAAVEICNRFIDRGVIVSTTGPIHVRPQQFFANEEKTYGDFPVIILINKGSASASEILAGCLKSHGRALIVGNRTFGKGSVQNIFPLSLRMAYFKLTTQYYKIPSGRIIHRRPNQAMWGIDPDVDVKVSEQQYADLLEARTLLDVLRNADEKIDPDAIIRKRDDDDEADPNKPKIETAGDILKHGLDPQLEVSLILMKNRILAGK